MDAKMRRKLLYDCPKHGLVDQIAELEAQLAEARKLLRQLQERDNAEIDEPWYSSPLPHYLRADIDALLDKESE